MIQAQIRQRGFSLTELGIVLGVMGVLIGAIWGYATMARQSAKVEQAGQMVSLAVDAVRSAYGGQSSIAHSTSTIVPNLIKMAAIPGSFLRLVASTCSGVVGNYIDAPWGAVTTDPCGTLHMCAWTYSSSTACDLPNPAPVSSQFFSIEFTQLTYGSCISLAERIAPSSPSGLADVVINGSSTVGAGDALPVPPSLATSNCTVNSNANTIDFVYKLRAPVS